MIIINYDKREYFAASRKNIPSLIQDLAGEDSIENVVNNSTYYEFNTRTNRIGWLHPFHPLSDIIMVGCSLIPQAGESEEETENVE